MEDKNIPWLNKDKKEKLRKLCGCVNSRIDLNKVLEWVRYHEDEKNEETNKKEKIGCPITLGEYEEILRKDK